MGKKELRSKCRERWGNDWHKCNPVIKKARMQWASGQEHWQKVLVTEGDGVAYTV